MSYAVELFFDGASEAKLALLRRRCAEAGGLPAREDESRPHVSLVVADALKLAKAQVLIERFARDTRSFPLTLASVGFFPSKEQVAFLAPKVDASLLALHEKFHGQFGAVASGLWPHYAPASWVPHCTLATYFPFDRVAALVELCGSFGLPLRGNVVEIGIVQFPPTKQLFSTSLR